MLCPHFSRILAFPALAPIATSFVVEAAGQAAGEFVVPGLRGEEDAEFSYWDVFEGAPGQNGGNFEYGNPPALGGGVDDCGNISGARGVVVQDGTDSAFVTSSRAIYSFAEPTMFRLDYPSDKPVTNVIFQALTGGTRLTTEVVKLVFTPEGGGEIEEVAPDFLARDNPGTGAFSERLMSAFQWDLTGLDVRDFAVVFESPESSMPLWQSQIDVVAGSGFVRELGYLLRKRTAPQVVSGVPGGVGVDLPQDAEIRYFLPGDSFGAVAEPEDGWAVVGWAGEGESVVPGDTLPVSFGEADEIVHAIFAPLDYSAWRAAFFSGGNSFAGEEPDNTNDDVSGEQADPDGDGLANLAEFAFGGNPLLPDPERTGVRLTTVGDGGIIYPAITYRRWETPDLESELDYFILAGETPGGGEETEMVEVSREVQQDGTVLVTVRSSVPVAARPRQFFTVVAEVFQG